MPEASSAAEETREGPDHAEAMSPAAAAVVAGGASGVADSDGAVGSRAEEAVRTLRAVERARQLALAHIDAEASALYYASVAKWMSRANVFIEVLIAIGTGSSIAAWSIWDTAVGSTFWAALLGAVAVANIVKPMLGLGQRIKKTENRATRWNEVAIQLRKLSLNIRSDGGVTPTNDQLLSEAYSRFDELSHEDSPTAANWYFDRVCSGVKKRYPPGFYWPRYSRKSETDLTATHGDISALVQIDKAHAADGRPREDERGREAPPAHERPEVDEEESESEDELDEQDGEPTRPAISGGHDQDY